MPIPPRHMLAYCTFICMFFADSFAEVVPTDYVTYSIEETKIGDRAGTNGQGLVGSKADILIGSEARVYGSVLAKGNVKLYDRSTVYGNATAGLSVIKTAGVVVTGVTQQNAQVPVYTIPARTVPTGSQDFVVLNDQSRTINPGNFDTIKVFDRGILTVNGGIYNAKAILIGNDVKFIMNISSGGGLELNAAQDFVIGDRIKMSFSAENCPTAISFYSNGTSEMVVGYEGVAYGMYIAPNAKIIIHDRTTFSGTVYGKKVELQPTVFFLADTVFPSMHLSSPIAGSTINTATPKIAIWYGDDKSGIDKRTFQVSINGVDRTSMVQLKSDSAIWQIPQANVLPEGSITVVSYIEDRAGNAIQNTAAFYVDISKPVVAITSPADGWLSNNGSPLLKATFSDARSGISTTSFNATLNGTSISNKFTIAVDNAQYQIPANQPLSDGVFTFVSTISDIAGNQQQTSVSFTIDKTPPVVAIVSPADNTLTKESQVTLVWKIDDVTQPEETVTLANEGPNVITRSSTDAAGNTGTKSITINRDTQAPDVQIVSPADGFLTKETQVTLFWKIDDVTQPTETVTLENEGANIITRSATDAAGNTGTKSITVNRDTQAPDVEITGPTDNFLTKEHQVALTWSIDDVPQPEEIVTLENEGANVISRSATDAAGNTGTKSITVNRDTQAPDVQITSPADGFLTKESQVTLVWKIDDVTQPTETVTLENEGPNIITRSSSDAAGNTGTKLITVNRDTQAPDVQITSPADGFLTKASQVTLVWKIDEIAQPVETVTLENEGPNVITRSSIDAAGNTGTASITVNRDTQAPIVAITNPVDAYLTNDVSLTVAWTIDDISQTDQIAVTLTEGANTITRSATDAAGNVGIATITVNLDTQAPLVAITSPGNNFLTKESHVAFTWTINGVTQPEETVDLPNEGANVITRSSTDAAGNTGTASITVNRDMLAPVVAIISPTDGFITKQTPIEVAWSIDGFPQTFQTSEDLVEGQNTITRSVTDIAGNTGTASASGSLDTRAPVVVITSPVDGFVTDDDEIVISWTVDDVVQNSQTVVSLVEGSNTIIRTATDVAGNTGADTIDVTLDSGCVEIVNTTLTINADNLSYDGKSLCITNSTVNIYGFHSFDSVGMNHATVATDTGFEATTVTLNNSSVLTHFKTTTQTVYGLRIITKILSVDATSKIDANGRGYLGDKMVNNVWRGARTIGNIVRPLSNSSSSYVCGGSHGGTGGHNNGNPTSIYGDAFGPIYPGGGGGAYTFLSNCSGGDGGGVVYIIAEEMLVNGTISADGGGGHNTSYNGHGAGGSIWLVADELTGSGSIHADGGHSTNHYAGSGGRIFIDVGKTFTLSIEKISTVGGVEYREPGQNGTTIISVGDRDSARSLYVFNPSRAAGYSVNATIKRENPLYDEGLLYVCNT